MTGWASVKLLDVLVITVGPVLAMSIGTRVRRRPRAMAELRRPLTNGERLGAVRLASWFMLLAVPPALFVVAMTLAGSR